MDNYLNYNKLKELLWQIIIANIMFRHYSNSYSMELEEINPLERPHYLNCVYAMETVYDAYYKGFINWNTLNIVV